MLVKPDCLNQVCRRCARVRKMLLALGKWNRHSHTKRSVKKYVIQLFKGNISSRYTLVICYECIATYINSYKTTVPTP